MACGCRSDGSTTEGVVDEIESIRESVRLGGDAFSTGQLSETTIDAAVAAFERFAARIEAHGVDTRSRRRDQRRARSIERAHARRANPQGHGDSPRDHRWTSKKRSSCSPASRRRSISPTAPRLLDRHGRRQRRGHGRAQRARARLRDTRVSAPCACSRRLKESGKTEADVDDLIAPFRGAVAGLRQSRDQGPEARHLHRHRRQPRVPRTPARTASRQGKARKGQARGPRLR